MPEVTIEHKAKDANISEISMSTVNINPARLRKTPLVFGEADIVKALTLQTGISTIGEGAGSFSVRGGNSDQNLILLDGAPFFNSAHLLGFYSTVSPEAVQYFTLYKGAFPASSGGRLSSLLALNVRPGNPDSIHYGGSVSPVRLHLFEEGPLIRKSKLTFSADGRMAYPKLLMNQFPGDTSYNWRSDIIAVNGKSDLNKKWSVYYSANISYYSSGITGTVPGYQFMLKSSIRNEEPKALCITSCKTHLF